MSFLHLWAFGFAALAPVIVALYLLKVRRRPLTVSTLMFWQRVLEENQRRALFQRLRQWLSLLLHLLIFALLVLALAKPTLDEAVREGSSTVLVLDTRARMQAREANGETRMVKARRAAEAFARQASGGRQMAVLAGESRLGFTGDEQALRGAIEATKRGGTLEGDLRLAKDLLASRAGEKRIVVFSDRAETAEGVEFQSVGTPRENGAILRFAARAVPANPETFEILLEVANFRSQPWSGNVEVTLDGKLLDVRPWSLAAGERKTMIFPAVVKAPTRGEVQAGKLVARLDGADDLPLDDTATATLPLAPPRRVLLVTKSNWFLEKLLAADLRLRYELLSPEGFRAEMAGTFDVVIVDDLAEFAKALPEQGNVLFLKQSPLTVAGPDLERPLITDAEAQHPALRLAELEHVSLSRAVKLQVPAEAEGWQWEVPLRFGEIPLLVCGARGSQRVAVLAFGVGDSDLPLRVAFPLLMDNLIHWLAGERKVEAPVLVEKNLFDEKESDLRAASFSTVAPSVAINPASWSGWPLWRWLALAAALLFAMEWWLFHRRQTE